jgi:hypothetical protein
MTTFSDFQDYFLRLMWRTGDTEFTLDLPRLVKKAEARINRDLRLIGQTADYQTPLENEDSFTLPDDYAEARAITVEGYPGFLRPITLQDMQARRADGRYSMSFAQDGNIMFINLRPDATSPPYVSMSYYTKVPPYELVDDPEAETFYDKYPDFYEAALRVQCYDYLREFELSAEYNGKYQQLLEGMREFNASQQFPAGAIPFELPGIVM